ncbi:myosin tail region-interacting protein MTI1-like isoform X2 [Penaeus monodon]|uniref:myosin tail region-interacting protein MTI1-like isoform X2 n=1 Tax=Penaeus monodon TaxID=6687 RepID=UPI0018A6DF63|nr:myosin tail region-interacting protein MTI1-like isoform X2 [Penaeus monodon]
MIVKLLAVMLIGVCATSADRNLASFVAGRPISHGVPGAQTFGGVPSFQRPQVDPRPPSFQRPQVDPRPPSFQRPQVDPRPPSFQRPQVDPRPPGFTVYG